MSIVVLLFVLLWFSWLFALQLLLFRELPKGTVFDVQHMFGWAGTRRAKVVRAVFWLSAAAFPFLGYTLAQFIDSRK